MPAPYTRTHNFAADTNLVAGTGDVAVRVGVGDELAAAQAGAHALAPEHFAAGIFQHEHLATPRNCYTARFGFVGDWGPARWNMKDLSAAPEALGGYIYLQERVLATFTSSTPFRVTQIELAARGLGATAYRNADVLAAGNEPPHVTFMVRRNGRHGGRLCRDLNALDLRLPAHDGTNQQDAIELPTTMPRYVCRIGSELGDVPLLLTEFAADDRVTIAASWRSFWSLDQTAHYTVTALGTDWLVPYTVSPPPVLVPALETAYFTSPAVTIWVQQLFA